MRSRLILFGLAAAAIAVLATLGYLDTLAVDYLWYRTLGYGGVFDTTLGAQIVIFIAVWIVAFVVILVSGLAAVRMSRGRPPMHVVHRNGEMAEINLPELIRSLGDRIPWKWIVTGVAAILAAFVAQGEAANWTVYLEGLYGVKFGILDPAFANDLGFYVFRMPFLEELRDLFLTIVFLAAAVAAGVYWARDSIDFAESPPRISPAATAHLSLLLALFFVQRAMSYWLDRFELMLHTNGVVFGLRYVDHVLWQPGLWVLVALAFVAAAISLANMRERGIRLPVAAAVIVFGPALLLSFAQPIIEKIWVKPDELRIEKPYLARNIAMTRHAFQLDGVDVKPFGGNGVLTPVALQQDAATIQNIRIWDPRPLIATYKQLQEIRTYYDFRGVDIDRYWIGGKYTQVMLSAREMNLDQLPANAQTWVNRHLKFTHGSGLVMSPVNRKDSEGLPVLYVKNIPPVSTVGIDIKQPAVYFGEETDSYAVVDSATPEFDYPRGADNVFGFYKGSGGVPVSGLLRRAIFSLFYRDFNLLVTENIVPKSKIMIRRNIVDRINYLAPFLALDHDPYPVTIDGRIKWIVDCYTTSDHYPYSQLYTAPDGEQLNYIRNSVKAVVDAYTGAVTFYVFDPSDPVIQTWERVFPDMFRPLSAVPANLRAHVRYPEDFFLVQADLYRTYHMTDPQVFYNREDLWDFPRENFGGETMRMQPYYVIMRLPGEAKAEYMLMLPMVPQGRDNMISWLAARCDGSDYGHLFEYSFSKEKLFYGPYQIQARINQSPEISRQLSLWNQQGSRAILGNLLVIPIEDSLLYVEPLYLRAESGQLPEMQRVVAAYSDRVVMGDTLDVTLASLFTGPALAAPAPVIAAVAPAKEVMAGGPGMRGAAAHYSRALTALRAGDWTAFGAEMDRLGDVLGQPPPPPPKSDHR
ncbi:MAG: UPF0182 family protein [Candidatus Binataceae bacterium]